LTGHGADEWFGRNPYYYDELLRTGSYGTLLGQCLYDMRMTKAPASVVREVAAPAIRRFAPKPVVRAAKETLARLRRRDAAATVVVPAAGYRAAPLERLQSSGRCRRLEHLAHCRLHSLVNLGESVRAIELEDRAASRAGVEERTPFEDRRVVEFGFSIPERLRSKAAGKYILRTALRGVLPESVRMRTEKAEFSPLLAQVLLDPMVAGSLACRRLADRGLVDRLAVAAKYNEFKSLYEDGADGYVKHVWQLWMAFALETWVGMMENR
jgi:asparagine synthase (glutamine-hydrolysing)